MLIETTCISFPNQVEGKFSDGRPFYFRARHGHWTLHVGKVGWKIGDEAAWIIEDGFEVAEGDSEPEEDWEVLQILADYCKYVADWKASNV